MGKIINTPDGMQVTLTPEELVKATVFSKTMEPIGLVDNLIRRVCWYYLYKYGKIQKGRQFTYGDLTVVDGKFVANFSEIITIPEDPGPA